MCKAAYEEASICTYNGKEADQKTFEKLMLTQGEIRCDKLSASCFYMCDGAAMKMMKRYKMEEHYHATFWENNHGLGYGGDFEVFSMGSPMGNLHCPDAREASKWQEDMFIDGSY